MLNKTKMDKEFQQEVLIAETLVEIEDQRKDIDNLTDQLFEAACEAAKMNNDTYADELDEIIADFQELGEELKAVALEIKTCAITARVMAKLGKLPAALKACKAVFAKAPDFTKLGREYKSLRDALASARLNVKSLRSEISRAHMTPYERIYGKKTQDDPKRAQRIDNIKKAREARLVSGIATTQPATNRSDNVSAADEARIDAIAAMLDEERKGE